MKSIVLKISVFILILMFNIAVVSPDTAFARHRTSSLRSKINDLDNDRVIELPVPILFGITPLNLYPNFGDPRGAEGGRTHEGLDIMAPKGAPVASPTEAVVTRIGKGDSAGLYVYTANPGGESMAYLHLSEFADIDEGDVLKVGEIIGYVGNTGNAQYTLPHLHYELHNDDGDPIDPLPRLTRIFPLKNKISGLEQALDEINDDDKKEELIDFVITKYRSDFLLAQTLNIALPSLITEALKNKVAEVGGITRTLRLGMQGDDVEAMQIALGVNADGSFGPITKSALIAFQISKGLIGDGVFGPVSRLALMGTAGVSTVGCTATTKYSPITGAICPVI